VAPTARASTNGREGILRVTPMLFRDRADAGRFLADKLAAYADGRDTVVLGLPRGGVPVAFEVATALNAALDVFVVRKLGVPGQEELAMGATASGKVRVLNHEIIRALGISDEAVASVAAKEERELERREGLYRGGRPQYRLDGKTAILVDDGLATGSTMRAAVEALKRHRPARVVVGVPVAAVSTCEEFINEVDEIVCAMTPQPFYAVGRWYEEFSRTTDEEVQDLLSHAPEPTPRI
jgi:putative phosphoribosyl transferase